MNKNRWIILVFILVFSIKVSGVDDKERADSYFNILNQNKYNNIAMEWLSLLKDPRVIPFLSNQLEPNSNQRFAIKWLGKTGLPDSIIPIIQYILTDKSLYFANMCFETLRQIDPEWMNRSSVKAFIPQCKSKMELLMKRFRDVSPSSLDDFEAYESYVSLASSAFYILKLFNLIGPEEAIPINQKIVKKYPFFFPFLTTLAVNSLGGNKVNKSRDLIINLLCDVSKLSENSLEKLRYDEYSIIDEEDYRVLDNAFRSVWPGSCIEALNKIDPEWRSSDLFKKKLNGLLKIIERETSFPRICYAIDVVKLLSPSRMVLSLKKLALTPNQKKKLKIYAILTLAEISPEEYFDFFVSGLTTNDIDLHYCYLLALGITRNVKAIPYLLDEVKNSKSDIQFRPIINVLKKWNSPDTTVILVNIAEKTERVQIVFEVLGVLSGIKPNPPGNEILQITLNSMHRLSQLNKYERQEFYSILAAINDPVIMDYLIKEYPLFEDDIKKCVLEHLSTRNDKRLLPIFQKELNNPDNRVRVYAEYGVYNLSR